MRTAKAAAFIAGALAIPGCGRIGFEHLDSKASTAGAREDASLGPDGSSASGAKGGTSSGGFPSTVMDATTGPGGTGDGGGTTSHRDGGNTDAGSPDASTGRDASSGSGGAQGAGGTSGAGGGGAAGAGGTSGSVAIDLTKPSATVLSGTATIGSGEIDLTLATRDAAGAAFLPSPYLLTATTRFSVAFSFSCSSSSGQAGDGFALVWQNDPRGSAALGVAGGGLGYGGITPSVDVEFDVFGNSYDPGGNEITITTDGDYMTYTAHAPAPFTISDGATHYAWVDYDEATKTLSVYAGNTTARPASPVVTTTVDLSATLGNQAYLGFTAGTGTTKEVHAIQSLTVAYTR
jgi:hypothetical protein